MVTAEPTGPETGFTLVMEGAVLSTVKVAPLLPTPFTVTTTFPVVAPIGTVMVMLLSLNWGPCPPWSR
jgi:hypothetical protein